MQEHSIQREKDTQKCVAFKQMRFNSNPNNSSVYQLCDWVSVNCLDAKFFDSLYGNANKPTILLVNPLFSIAVHDIVIRKCYISLPLPFSSLPSPPLFSLFFPSPPFSSPLLPFPPLPLPFPNYNTTKIYSH